jgi:hypothetical protein
MNKKEAQQLASEYGAKLHYHEPDRDGQYIYWMFSYQNEKWRTIINVCGISLTQEICGKNVNWYSHLEFKESTISDDSEQYIDIAESLLMRAISMYKLEIVPARKRLMLELKQ